MGLGRLVGGLFATFALAWGVFTSSGCTNASKPEPWDFPPVKTADFTTSPKDNKEEIPFDKENIDKNALNQTQSQPQTFEEKIEKNLQTIPQTQTQTVPQTQKVEKEKLLYSAETKFKDPQSDVNLDVSLYLSNKRNLEVYVNHHYNKKNEEESLRLATFDFVLEKKKYQNITKENFLEKVKPIYEKDLKILFSATPRELAKKLNTLYETEGSFINEEQVLELRNPFLQKIMRKMEYINFDFYDANKLENKLPQFIIIGENHGSGSMQVMRKAIFIKEYAPKNSFLCMEDPETDSEKLKKTLLADVLNSAYSAAYHLCRWRNDITLVGIDTDVEAREKTIFYLTQNYIGEKIYKNIEKNKLNDIDKWFIKYFKIKETDNLKKNIKEFYEEQRKKTNEQCYKRDKTISKNIINEIKKRKITGFAVLGAFHADVNSNKDLKDDTLLQELKKQDISYIAFLFEENKSKKAGTKPNVETKYYWENFIRTYVEQHLKKANSPFTEEEIIEHYVN